MTDPYLALVDFLRLAVPGAYLFMCLYIGFVGYTSMESWIYLITFGSFGLSSYMLLNEPDVLWIPLWITSRHWFVVSMITLLLVGVLLFITAMKSQDLDWPWEIARKWRERLRSYLSGRS